MVSYRVWCHHVLPGQLSVIQTKMCLYSMTESWPGSSGLVCYGPDYIQVMNRWATNQCVLTVCTQWRHVHFCGSNVIAIRSDPVSVVGLPQTHVGALKQERKTGRNRTDMSFRATLLNCAVSVGTVWICWTLTAYAVHPEDAWRLWGTETTRMQTPWYSIWNTAESRGARKQTF